MFGRIRQLLHLHWFSVVWTSYAYAYEECRCSKRRARSIDPGNYAPVAMWWLEGRPAPRTVAPPAEVRSGVSGVR